MLFPSGDLPSPSPRTGLELDCSAAGLPEVRVGRSRRRRDAVRRRRPDASARTPGMPLLGEHATGRYTRPHLRGHRLRPGGGAGRAWTTSFETRSLDVGRRRSSS